MQQDDKQGLNQKPIFKVKDVLNAEVAPALGCTEPVAIALAAAAAASLIPGEPITTLEIWVDPNIYKNGIAVAIPGTQGLNGLDLAGALGALGGDPSRRLEVLATIDKTIVQDARKLLDSKKVTVNLIEDRQGLYVKTIVKSSASAAEAIIENLHDNIVSLMLNGEPVVDSALLSTGKDGGQKSNLMNVEAWLKQLSLYDLVELLDDLDDDDLAFLEEGVRYNMRLAEYGLKHGSGLGIGKTLERLVRQGLIKKDMIVASRILTAAASDARMAGAPLPAMSSAGSGNHGLTAILPIWAVKDYIECDKKVILEAIGISHIITAYGQVVSCLRLFCCRGRRRCCGDYASSGGDPSAYGRCHHEPHRRSGRSHLRWCQGRLLPEAGNRRRNRCSISPLCPAGSTCTIHGWNCGYFSRRNHAECWPAEYPRYD